MRDRPRPVLGCESLVAGNGGICRVARLVARVLSDEVAAGRIEMPTSVVLSDTANSNEFAFTSRSARGSRTRFVLGVNSALITNTHFIYDCGGMARSHQWLPFPSRPSLSFLCGIEAWRETHHHKQVQALLRCEKLVAISAYTRDRATLLAAAFAKAEVCWLATEANDPAPQVPAPSRPRVLILSRLDSYKGHQELLRCWPRVLRLVPDAVLSIAGKGPQELELRALASELGLSDAQVEFLGFVPEDRIDDLWQSTSVFAMPSRGEGFGLVYIEAMRYAIPVVASTHDAAPEINLDGVTGWNVSLDNPDELPDRLISLLRDPQQATKMGRAGQTRWNDHFRYSAFRERFRPILHAFLGIE